MKTDYEVSTETFSGPLDKLLHLIEEKELEITEVSLADVTADFLVYVKNLEQHHVEPRILADFLVVAARLILIKSKVLLPSLDLTEEEETDIHDLESRLKIYKEFKRAGEYVRERYESNQSSFSRPLFRHLGTVSVFYPPHDLSIDDIQRALHSMLAVLKELQPATQEVAHDIVTIEEKIEELLGRLQSAASERFSSLSTDKSRSEIIVLFLAILQLFRQRIIDIEQSNQFGDIIISKSDEEAVSSDS